MKKQRRFNIEDDMQLNYVICALETSTMSSRFISTASQMSSSIQRNAYDALGRARTLLHEFQRDSLGIVDGSEGESIDESCK